MKKKFSIFQNHLDLSHQYLSKLLQKGDCAIDATCGNGFDTLFLAELCLSDNKGQIISMDIQKIALNSAKQRIQETLPIEIFNRITFIEACHSNFPIDLIKKPKAIIYNLGYLPGGNKSITTLTETTLISIRKACDLIEEGGVISITCYPGHEEGLKEEAILLDYVSSLSPFQWSCCYHQWRNRSKSPSLILLQKGNTH